MLDLWIFLARRVNDVVLTLESQQKKYAFHYKSSCGWRKAEARPRVRIFILFFI